LLFENVCVALDAPDPNRLYLEAVSVRVAPESGLSAVDLLRIPSRESYPRNQAVFGLSPG
jgi:hypothetical protein